jgi:molecular chaperone DnaJ
VPIPFYDAILGGVASIPTLEGSVNMRIPAGTQPGDVRTIGNRGVQKLSQAPGVRGNLNAVFKIKMPRASELNGKQREILESYRALYQGASGSSSTSEHGFLRKTIDKLKESLCEEDDNVSDKSNKKQGKSQ